VNELAWHPVVHLAGTGDVVLVVLARAGQTNSATTLNLFLPTSGDRLYGAMVERRDGPSWLRDDDDDDDHDDDAGRHIMLISVYDPSPQRLAAPRVLRYR